MKVNRREFLQAIGRRALGVLALTAVPGLLLGRRGTAVTEAAPESKGQGYDSRDHYWGFVVDTTACIGCGKCVLACKLENDVPMEPDYFRTWVERYVINEGGQIFADSPKAGIDGPQAEYANLKYRDLELRQSFFVPKLCNQCDRPPCVTVCPTGASYMTEDGVILINRNTCIGCKYCIVACPYGARFILPDLGVADKCNFCYHRITKGLLPACVQACPVGARVFGDLRDPESPVSRVLREKRSGVLKPALGTKPKVYYVGLEAGV